MCLAVAVILMFKQTLKISLFARLAWLQQANVCSAYMHNDKRCK